MQLITFAHKPEAQAFFDAFTFRSTSTEGLYQTDFGWILITGEGIHEALASVALILGSYPQIKKIINLGVAGSLSEKTQLHQVYSVRTVYAFEESFQFKSFSLNGDVDLVTSSKRVLNEDLRTPLLAMGSMVDRELWGICFAAKMRNVSVESYKYISDKAGELGACEVVKDLALKASLALLEKFKNLSSEASAQEEFNLPGFYFTFSQSHQFKTLLQKLAIKKEKSEQQILESFKGSQLLQGEILPKERTKKLIQMMKVALDPWGSEFEEKNIKRLSELKHIQVSSPTHFQTSDLKIVFNCSSIEEFEIRLNELNAFNWADFFNQFKVSDV